MSINRCEWLPFQDVDIKRQGAISAYAFVQYSDISSVVKALWDMEEEQIGGHKIKVRIAVGMLAFRIMCKTISKTRSASGIPIKF